VLNEVQIYCCELLQVVTQISYNGNSLQENLGKQNCGSNVQINAASIELSHNGAEESKIVEAGFAEFAGVTSSQASGCAAAPTGAKSFRG